MAYAAEATKIQGLRTILHTSSEQNESVERVTLEQLEARPNPVALGRFHQPLRYEDIVRGLNDALIQNGIEALQQELILARGGKLLMGVVEVNGENAIQLPGGVEGRTLLAFHASDAQFTSFKLKAGAQVFTCDNLSLSARDTLVMHKFTTKAQILNRIKEAIIRWLGNKQAFEMRLNELNQWQLSEGEAAKEILQLAAGDPQLGTRGVIPFKYAQSAYDNYFKPQGPDTEPRTKWGLYNAWTRALREAPVQARVSSTIALSAFYEV